MDILECILKYIGLIIYLAALCEPCDEILIYTSSVVLIWVFIHTFINSLFALFLLGLWLFSFLFLGLWLFGFWLGCFRSSRLGSLLDCWLGCWLSCFLGFFLCSRLGFFLSNWRLWYFLEVGFSHLFLEWMNLMIEDINFWLSSLT